MLKIKDREIAARMYIYSLIFNFLVKRWKKRKTKKIIIVNRWERYMSNEKIPIRKMYDVFLFITYRSRDHIARKNKGIENKKFKNPKWKKEEYISGEIMSTSTLKSSFNCPAKR